MVLNNYFKNKIPFLAVLGLLFGLSSCGSYQYAGQNNDGIYDGSYKSVEYQERNVQVANTPEQGNAYYKNYFKEKSLEYETDSIENCPNPGQ